MQTYTTPSPITAVLDIPAGRIKLIAADRADTTVEIRPADASKSHDVTAAEQTTVGFADGVLRVEAGPASHRVLGRSGSVEVTVQLPVGSRVEAKAASSEFRTVGRLGDVTLDGSQAAVKVDEAATARLSVDDGTVSVGRLGGDIQVSEAVRGALTLATQDGSITVGAAAGVSAALDADTSLGRINNALKNAGTPALTIHATTSRGDITARGL